MTEGRCVSCESWDQIPSENPICEFGSCRSKDAVKAAGGMLMPTSAFGCRFWNERGPDLREQLAEYAHACVREGLLPYSELNDNARSDYLRHADKIIAMFEKHRS